MTEPQQPRYQVTHVSPEFTWASAPMPSITPAELLPPRPATLTAASWVWLAATLCGVLALPVLLFFNSEPIATSMYEDSLRNDPDPMSLEQARITTTVLAFMAVFFGLAVAVPFVIGALKLRAGKNWARILLAVFGGVALIYNLVLFASSFAADRWQAGVVMTVATAGLTLAAVVLMFLPPSNSYVSVADGR